MVEISFVKRFLYYIDNYYIWPHVFCLQIHVTIMFHLFPITMVRMTMVVTTLSLGLQPRQGTWKGVGWECNLWITLTLSGVQMWENEPIHSQMNSHFGVPMDFQIFKEQFEKSKLIWLNSYLYQWKILEMYMF